jgi:hypothetical protein
VKNNSGMQGSLCGILKVEVTLEATFYIVILTK